MPKDPVIRENYTKDRSAARKLPAQYFEQFRKFGIESWRHLQSANIEFMMKRLREPIEPD